ncbi:MAG: bifunctional phosphoribosylaminoimidazolecarboxamide formyltransferase/IMP cyclohydrolase [Deinococcus sp.]|nr:bifunctional phosphoribosylaminoimidazolecarboxamide formyltransferase/IMP cyclohydrolase [Deinococcus sp.]
MLTPVTRAILSVWDKTGIVELARGLAQSGVELISTGGTHQALTATGLKVTAVSDLTGFPEILGGRVKSLHPVIHGAILSRRSPEDQQQLSAHLISPIDLVVVNLYPFADAAARGATLAEAIEQIDIGGPTLLRSAAKNHAWVGAVVDPDDYPQVLAELAQGGLSEEFRQRLALKVFRHTARYDAAISAYLARSSGEGDFPRELFLSFSKVCDLRYGENPHQRAALYRESAGGGLSGAQQLWGKELSYNNLGDAEAALNLVAEFSLPAAVAVKHASPCGVAVAPDLATAYQRAHDADPVSIFGGVVALNQAVDPATAQALGEIFLEVVVAPDYHPEALELLRRKKNLRLLQVPLPAPTPYYDLRRLRGGLLVQDADLAQLGELQVVTRRAPSEAELRDLRFAWPVVRQVRSNAIVLAKESCTVGIGGGQPNRVDAARIAIERAGERARGAVLASDAFFPFPDTVQVAAQAGVTALIQPGGSVRDQESIAAADAHGLAMVFTGLRCFRH